MSLQLFAHPFPIELEGIDPPVWRRIRVRSSYSFWDLHVAIQDAMGWLDYHLHLFHVRNPEAGQLESIGIPDDGRTSMNRCACPAGTCQSPDTSQRKATPLPTHTTWRHTVVLEGVDTIQLAS